MVYDSDTADILHHVDVFTSRKILSVTPEGHYFEAIYGGMAIGWAIFPQSRLWSIRWAVKHKAPDDVLERLGVEILRTVKSDELYNLMSADLVWGERRLFNTGYDFLARNHDGRFFLFRDLDILGIRIRWVKPKTQRQALRWAVWNVPNSQSEAFQMLGVCLIDGD